MALELQCELEEISRYLYAQGKRSHPSTLGGTHVQDDDGQARIRKERKVILYKKIAHSMGDFLLIPLFFALQHQQILAYSRNTPEYNHIPYFSIIQIDPLFQLLRQLLFSRVREQG